MLVLRRRPDECIVMRDRQGRRICTVMIVDVVGDQVRLGFNAPRGVIIHREEIDRIVQKRKKR